MGGALSLGKYQRVAAVCEACSQRRGATRVCPRCTASLCRACWTRTCAVTVGGLALSLPLPLLLRRFPVCDGCMDAERREAAFVSNALPFLTTGAAVTRVSQSLFSETQQQVWLRLDVSKRAFEWRSLEMVRQEPKEAGSFSVDDVAGTQSGDGAAAAAGLKRGTLTGARDVEHTTRLVSDRGHTVFLFTTGQDARAFARWSACLPELLSSARLPHCRCLPSRSALIIQHVAESAAGSARQQSAAAREARTAARGAFRESFGPVGMTHTAQVLAGRGEGGAGGAGGGGSAAVSRPAAGDTSRVGLGSGTLAASGREALSEVSSRLSRLGEQVGSRVPDPVADVGRTLGAGLRLFGASAAQLLKPPGG